ncbi:hypothetical protein [Roseicella aerolata]|uniref:Uncharacterized protein n=1 Tax=Roseicella aerolata TaxID=2883479 RepID=A0A9X1LCB4_9PROT|nr:hypothetical protein [Roseicella aerolata]MCB4823973.1 hypothetical protein [Roseicella aerolata]
MPACIPAVAEDGESPDACRSTPLTVRAGSSGRSARLAMTPHAKPAADGSPVQQQIRLDPSMRRCRGMGGSGMACPRDRELPRLVSAARRVAIRRTTMSRAMGIPLISSPAA